MTAAVGIMLFFFGALFGAACWQAYLTLKAEQVKGGRH